MQLSVALIAAILSTAVSAAPALTSRNAPSLTFQISNDMSGRQASATIIADGIARDIFNLFKDSAINKNGHIVGTSAMLTSGFTDATRCFFQKGNTVINFNGRKTWVDLDGNPNALTEVDLNGFNIQCS